MTWSISYSLICAVMCISWLVLFFFLYILFNVLTSSCGSILSAQLSIRAWIFYTAFGLHSSFIQASRNGLIASSSLGSTTPLASVSSLFTPFHVSMKVSFSLSRFNPYDLSSAFQNNGLTSSFSLAPPMEMPLCVITSILGPSSHGSSLTLCTFWVGDFCFSCIFDINIRQ